MSESKNSCFILQIKTQNVSPSDAKYFPQCPDRDVTKFSPTPRRFTYPKHPGNIKFHCQHANDSFRGLST